jgi:hypothetical protein
VKLKDGIGRRHEVWQFPHAGRKENTDISGRSETASLRSGTCASHTKPRSPLQGRKREFCASRQEALVLLLFVVAMLATGALLVMGF